MAQVPCPLVLALGTMLRAEKGVWPIRGSRSPQPLPHPTTPSPSLSGQVPGGSLTSGLGGGAGGGQGSGGDCSESLIL